jgi:hypothetical protein
MRKEVFGIEETGRFGNWIVAGERIEWSLCRMGI